MHIFFISIQFQTYVEILDVITKATFVCLFQVNELQSCEIFTASVPVPRALSVAF